MALIWSSRNGSSSSTTASFVTDEANFLISFSGSGKVVPSFSTAAFGKASRTYWKEMPEVMKPISLSPSMIRLRGDVSAHALSRRRRSSTKTWRFLALFGSITYLAKSFTSPRPACDSGVPVSTTLLQCEILVVVRRMTGVSKDSEISNAALTNCSASAESDGSMQGILPSRA